MPSFGERLADGWARAGEITALAAVPFVLSLTNLDAIAAIAAHDGFHISFKASLPFSVMTVWQFVDPPRSGVFVHAALPGSPPLAGVAVVLLAVLHALLSAGYFGRMADHVTGRDRTFVDCVRAHSRPFLVLVALPYLLFVPLAGPVEGAVVGLVVLAIPLLFVLAYLCYAAPYLVALRDTGVVEALRGSFRLAVDGGPHLRYTLGFAGLVFVVSPVMSVVVVNVPGVGLLVGIAAGAYLGLVCNVTTMRFVADIDPETGGGEGPATGDADPVTGGEGPTTAEGG